MYKGKIIKATAALLAVLLLTGCEAETVIDNVGDKVTESIDDAVSNAKRQVGDEIKKAVKNEIREFLSSSDWAETLGISAQEQESISVAIQEYVSSYEADEEQLEAAKESVETLLENAKGLSVEEIRQSIAEIFESD